MKPTDNLHQLVKSLTGSEKRYFKVFSKRHVVGSLNKYEQLFDIYDTLPDDHYDDDDLKQKVKKKNLGKNLADDKKNLQEMIMRAMLNFHSGNSIDTQLNDLLAEEDFYRQKRLNELRRKTIAKAKEIAEKYENYTVLLTLADRETNMRIELEQDKLAEIADHVGEEQGKWLDKINTKQELSKLDHWIFIQYRMNAKKDSKELRDMIEHKISLASFKNHLPGSSFKIDRNYFSIWSVYYLLKADFQKYNLYVSRMYELYEKQYPHQKNNDRIAYKVILFNYVYSLQMVKDFESMSRLLDHSQTIAPLNEDEAGETFQNQVFYKQLYYMNTSKFEEAVEMVPEIEEGIKKYRRKINTARQLTLYSNIAISYMMVNKWPEVLTYTEKIIAEKTSVRMEIKYEAMLHQLIARYELKQYDLLSYQIRNTQRQLNGKDTLTDAQAYVIKLLNSLIKDEKKHFTSLRKDADIAVANCKGYGVIQIWLYSRLYNISMIKAAPLLEH
jgi:hypothetical protein